MKSWISIILLCAVSLSAQTMTATIHESVETEFGTYSPIPVSTVPNALQVQLNEDLSNVINLSHFTLNEDQLEKLKANHFVVTPAVQSDGNVRYNEMFDLYCEARELGIPVFVTTDALLHSFHLCFDYILKTCEEDRFFSQLNLLLDALWGKTWEQYNAASDTTVQKALFRNLDVLLVASQLLLEKKFFTDPLPGGKYFEEITRVRDASGFQSSPIFSTSEFDYLEDYSQYKPRGHYTKSDSLKDYFRSMMWLGRMTFSCMDNGVYSQTMTLSAILLTQAISAIEINGCSGMDIWEDIYQPTVFFVGKSDDINFDQYLDIAYSVYGKSFPIYEPDTFGDPAKLLEFLEATSELESARITYPGQPDKGFRFMGQRFIPDSWILDELVYSKINGRFMPTGLDIMTVLGPEENPAETWAFRYISEQDKANADYITQLKGLKTTFQNYPVETWAQNAYWNWLYCLMPLLTEFGEGYPFFMQTDAWRDKALFAALASWAELRHDTILYAKQSGTETGIRPDAVLKQGYVEPNPFVFGRLASLADFMMEGLKSRNLLFEKFQFSLEAFSDLAQQLKRIAEKELTQTQITPEEYQLICEFGNRLFRIVTFNEYAGGPSPWSAEGIDPMPVIADVHTDANSMTVLEEGVGYPYAMYVLCSIEGRIMLTKGAGFSYYEFTQPLAQGRLTDEEWRDLLDLGTAPDPPEWSGHFISGQDLAMEAGFYTWRMPRTEHVSITLNKEQLTTEDTLRVQVETNSWYAETPVLTLQLPDGQTLPIVVTNLSGNQWQAIEALNQREPGVYSLTAVMQDLEYRISFSVTSGSGADTGTRPVMWRLNPAFPNPFNPETTIRFSLRAPSNTRLVILNCRGQIIRTLWKGPLSPGEHRLTWDGCDDQNSRMSSGVYMIQLMTGEVTFIQKIILIR